MLCAHERTDVKNHIAAFALNGIAPPTNGSRCPGTPVGPGVLVRHDAKKTHASDGPHSNARVRRGRRYDTDGMTRHGDTAHDDDDDDDDACASAFARLGLSVDEGVPTREVVRNAFRRLLIHAHPDRNGGNCAPYEDLCAARDRAYAIVDRQDILTCAARYDWKASRSVVVDSRDAGTTTTSATTTSATATTTTTTSGENVEQSTLTPHVRASFKHKTRVTALATLSSTIIATGERSGKVTLWSVVSGRMMDSFHAPPAEEDDAVSIIECGTHGQLAATYVKTKPHFVRIQDGLMSKPIATTADCHERRVTSATWFAASGVHRDPISDVFVTGALDGSVAIQHFTHGYAQRLAWSKTHAIIALATVVSSAHSGFLTVSDARGNFQIFRVDLGSKDGFETTTLSNVVTWNGFGGISRVGMTLLNDVDSRRIKIITVFNDVERHQSRVLEWSVSAKDGDVCADILGFDGAIPSEKSTFHGLITDFKRITMKTEDSSDDDDEDEECKDEDAYVIAVKDGIFTIDVASKSTLYALDVDVKGSFIHHDTSAPDVFTIVSLVGDDFVMRSYACDDGAPCSRASVTARDVFGDGNADTTTATTSDIRLLTTPRHVCSFAPVSPFIVVAARSTVLVVDGL